MKKKIRMFRKLSGIRYVVKNEEIYLHVYCFYIIQLCKNNEQTMEES